MSTFKLYNKNEKNILYVFFNFGTTEWITPYCYRNKNDHFKDRRCKGLMNKCSAYKKVVSRIVNSRERRMMYKYGLQKGCKQIRITME